MPKRRDGFTPKEQKYVEVFIETQDREKARKAAGYSKPGAWMALQRDDVRKAMNADMLSQMIEGRVLAQRNVLEELRRNGCSPRFSLDALKFFADTLREQEPKDNKDLHDLTLAEIQQAAAEARKQLEALHDVTPQGDTLDLIAKDVTPDGDIFG